MKHPLRAYRERNDLTQKALADLLGVGQSAISMIERGQRYPHPVVARQWSAKLGGVVSAADILCYVPPDTAPEPERAAASA